MATRAERIEHVKSSELRIAAIHEAGHACICRVLGGDGDPRVWANPSPEADERDEKAWLGTFKMRVAPGSVRSPSNGDQGFAATPSNWRVLIGLAGLVAEQIARGQSDPEQVGSHIECSFDLWEISDSDRQLIGEEWNYDEVEAVIAMLEEHWDDVEFRAAELINEALTSHHG